MGVLLGFLILPVYFFITVEWCFFGKKKYRFNNLLHEAHGTGPKLPKGRREIRRGIKPRKVIWKTHIFFLQIPLLLHVLIICNHLYSGLAKPWKNLLKFNWYIDIKMCIRLLSNKMLMEWYVQTIVFFFRVDQPTIF